MSSNADLRAGWQDFEFAIQKTANAAQMIGMVKSNLDSATLSLLDSWEGDGKNSFEPLAQESLDATAAIVDTLHQVKSGLEAVRSELTSGDQQVARMFG